MAEPVIAYNLKTGCKEPMKDPKLVEQECTTKNGKTRILYRLEGTSMDGSVKMSKIISKVEAEKYKKTGAGRKKAVPAQ